MTVNKWNQGAVFKNIMGDGIPVMAHSNSGRLKLFFCGSDSYLNLAEFTLEDGIWKNKDETILTLGMEKKINGTPAVVMNATGDGHIDIFAWVKDDNHLWHIKFVENETPQWKPWDNLGGKCSDAKYKLIESPTASGATGLLNVYFRASDHKYNIQWKVGAPGWQNPTVY